MRFAITASDRYLGVFNALLSAGWRPLRLFTVPSQSNLFSSKACIERAHALKMEIQLSRMRETDLQRLADEGCDILVVASYQWRIGNWAEFIPHAINFHPSLLPEFRGPYPLVNGLLARCNRWGVTCHKLAHDFDSGDVLASRAFDMTASDSHETLDLKTQMAATLLAKSVAGNFAALWAAATPQGKGSYAPLYDDAQRSLDFTKTVGQILSTVRAFGRLECLATVNGIRVHVLRAEGWQEAHSYVPGTVAHAFALATVVACSDGFIAILEWHLLGPAAISGTSRG